MPRLMPRASPHAVPTLLVTGSHLGSLWPRHLRRTRATGAGMDLSGPEHGCLPGPSVRNRP